MIHTPVVFAQDTTGSERAIDFARQVQPILAKHCYACHGPDEAEGGLQFTSKEAAFSKLDSGFHAIVAGKPGESEVFKRLTAEDEHERMPSEADPLLPEEIEIVRKWIQQGAQWHEHWGFSKPRIADVPKVDNAQWTRNQIDQFIYKQLQDSGLKPNSKADKRTLIRRATYDLIGLPPTFREVDAFLNDNSGDAWERLIDRLLDSPHYGERWGRHWLDLVRYAETNSYEVDGPKPFAWKYRDYVIQSLNDDKPYDKFVREQIAGDELKEVTVETMTATGFYRLGIYDNAPADRTLARADELDDIVTTISQVFLGLTVNCARCHDHKIDPISQADYYRMVSFVSDIEPYDNKGFNTNFDVSPPETRDRFNRLNQEVNEWSAELRVVEQRGIVRMSAEDQRKTEGRQRKQVLREKIKDYLSNEDWKLRLSLTKKINANRKTIKEFPNRETVLSVARSNANPPVTRVLFRGNPHVPQDEVSPGFPELFQSEPPTIPQPKTDAKTAGRRKVLAAWLTAPENRMTARVMANRVWQFHFGRGIVRSSNNFGQLGSPPTHPELLDYLAAQFATNDWKLKALHKRIMTSQAYQMSSSMNEAGFAKDPDNDLFWRFDVRRLGAEEVRDSLLAVNGSLNPKLYGPSIYEKLPQEVLARQSQPGKGWGTSSEKERNRRSIYIHVKRSLLTPMLSVFDLPDTDRSCEARFTTLQPGQALSLLNSEFVHTQAKRLATRINQMIDGGAKQKLTAAFELVYARNATQEEIESVMELISKLETEYKKSADESFELACLSMLNWNEFIFVD
ncbi:MAG: PSD1 and planctomycete cytochrome C domain-containing protein [Fuerstiella sp.]|nr:PSD1 and planctomycete cytochrome C domain-containing protein [Fuerstiella sp.]